jgi:hypothetical protein
MIGWVVARIARFSLFMRLIRRGQSPLFYSLIVQHIQCTLCVFCHSPTHPALSIMFVHWERKSANICLCEAKTLLLTLAPDPFTGICNMDKTLGPALHRESPIQNSPPPPPLHTHHYLVLYFETLLQNIGTAAQSAFKYLNTSPSLLSNTASRGIMSHRLSSALLPTIIRTH